jgi:hypothetical protein
MKYHKQTLSEDIGYNTDGVLSHNITLRVPVELEFKIDWFNDERIGYCNDGVVVIDKDGKIDNAHIRGFLYSILLAENDVLQGARGDIIHVLESITQTGEATFEEGPDYKATIEFQRIYEEGTDIDYCESCRWPFDVGTLTGGQTCANCETKLMEEEE